MRRYRRPLVAARMIRPWYAILGVWLALIVVLAANVAHYAQALR
jgi:hypothetical protein